LSVEHQAAMTPNRPLLELYDLDRDPHEVHNLAEKAEHSQVKDQLLGRLSTWMDSTNDFLPPPFRIFEGKQRSTL
jgi:hypothetical protein